MVLFCQRKHHIGCTLFSTKLPNEYFTHQSLSPEAIILVYRVPISVIRIIMPKFKQSQHLSAFQKGRHVLRPTKNDISIQFNEGFVAIDVIESHDSLPASSSSVISLPQSDHFDSENSSDLDSSKSPHILSSWADVFKIPHSALNALLSSLIPAGYRDLPRTAGTLLCTPTQNIIHQIQSGNYMHYGLETSIIEHLQR